MGNVLLWLLLWNFLMCIPVSFQFLPKIIQLVFFQNNLSVKFKLSRMSRVSLGLYEICTSNLQRDALDSKEQQIDRQWCINFTRLSWDVSREKNRQINRFFVLECEYYQFECGEKEEHLLLKCLKYLYKHI